MHVLALAEMQWLQRKYEKLIAFQRELKRAQNRLFHQILFCRENFAKTASNELHMSSVRQKLTAVALLKLLDCFQKLRFFTKIFKSRKNQTKRKNFQMKLQRRVFVV